MVGGINGTSNQHVHNVFVFLASLLIHLPNFGGRSIRGFSSYSDTTCMLQAGVGVFGVTLSKADYVFMPA